MLRIREEEGLGPGAGKPVMQVSKKVRGGEGLFLSDLRSWEQRFNQHWTGQKMKSAAVTANSHFYMVQRGKINQKGWGEEVSGWVGAIFRCHLTYLDPAELAGGDKGGGALLHQIRKLGVAREQTGNAHESDAGSRAPPSISEFLEKIERWEGLLLSWLTDGGTG